MELKEFIKETLVQIAEGVIDANEALKDKDVIINPSSDGKIVNTKGYLTRLVQNIEFNVSLSVEAKEGRAASVGVFASIVKAGVEGNTANSNTGIHSLKFQIPISLPFPGNDSPSSQPGIERSTVYR